MDVVKRKLNVLNLLLHNKTRLHNETIRVKIAINIFINALLVNSWQEMSAQRTKYHVWHLLIATNNVKSSHQY